MYILNAEKRDNTVKAKKLRREGIPRTVYGGNLEETLLIQMPEKEARKRLKMKLEGSVASLQYYGQQYKVLQKNARWRRYPESQRSSDLE